MKQAPMSNMPNLFAYSHYVESTVHRLIGLRRVIWHLAVDDYISGVYSGQPFASAWSPI